LCHGLPAEFATFLNYSRLLGLEDIPDYRYIFDLFKSLSLQEGLENDLVFDWDQAESASVQPQNRASGCIGQCKHDEPLKHHQGYVIFIFWTLYAYAYIKLCLGCTPRHINTSILMTLLLPNPPPLMPLGWPISCPICIHVNSIFKNELVIRV
jgi:hypothetical protein